MAIHTDAAKLSGYTPKGYPSLGSGAQRFISNELDKIQTAIANILTVIKAQEARMNSKGLS